MYSIAMTFGTLKEWNKTRLLTAVHILVLNLHNLTAKNIKIYLH